MQPEEEASIRHHPIGMRPGVAGARLRETEALVELDRRANIARADADLEEAAEHVRCAAARPKRRVPRRRGTGRARTASSPGNAVQSDRTGSARARRGR